MLNVSCVSSYASLANKIIICFFIFFVRLAFASEAETCTLIFSDFNGIAKPQNFKSFNGFELKMLAPSVFTVEGSQISLNEIATLQRFVKIFGGKAIAIGNFRQLRGLPAIDAIYFPENPKSGPINLSIKSSTSRDRTNAQVFFKRNIPAARGSIERFYSAEYFRKLFGIDLVGAQLIVQKGKSNKLERLQKYKEIVRLLGLDEPKPRKVLILLDLSFEVAQTGKMHQARDAFGDEDFFGVPPSDLLLRIYDQRIDEGLIAKPQMLNLSRLQRQIQSGEIPGLLGYCILLNNQTLMLTSKVLELNLYDSK